MTEMIHYFWMNHPFKSHNPRLRPMISQSFLWGSVRSCADLARREVKHMNVKALLCRMETVGGRCLPRYVHSCRYISQWSADHVTGPVFNYKHIYWGGMLVKKNVYARKACKKKEKKKARIRKPWRCVYIWWRCC